MANNYSDIHHAFNWIAQHLSWIGHDPPTNQKFFELGIEEMIMGLKNPKALQGITDTILVLEEPEMKVHAINDMNPHDEWSISFLVLKSCKVTDIAEQKAIKNETLGTAREVLAKFGDWRDKAPYTRVAELGTGNYWREFILDGTTFQPMNNFLDGRYGWRVSFTLREPYTPAYRPSEAEGVWI